MAVILNRKQAFASEGSESLFRNAWHAFRYELAMENIFPPSYFFSCDTSRGSHGCRCPRRFLFWVLLLQISVLRRAEISGLNPAFRLRLLDATSRVKPEAISNTCKGGYNARSAVGIFQETGFAPCEGGCRCPLVPSMSGRAPVRTEGCLPER